MKKILDERRATYFANRSVDLYNKMIEAVETDLRDLLPPQLITRYGLLKTFGDNFTAYLEFVKKHPKHFTMVHVPDGQIAVYNDFTEKEELIRAYIEHKISANQLDKHDNIVNQNRPFTFNGEL